MVAGAYTLEFGTQPSLPASGRYKIWVNAAGRFNLLNSSGINRVLSNINEETQLTDVAPNDEYLIWDTSAGELRKVSAENATPVAVGNRFVSYDEDEFTGTTPAGKLNWAVTISGTGASAQFGTYGVNGTERAFGVLQIDTGTTAAGRATLHRLVNQIQMGYCSFEQQWRVAIEELSTSTDRFIVWCGFIDYTAAGEPIDGVYFRYSDDVNGGQWQCICRESNVETVVNTTVAAITNYVRLRIVVNETATQAQFYIADALVATINTNLPSTAGNLTGIGAKIQKSVGTTLRNLSIDYFTQKVIWSTGR